MANVAAPYADTPIPLSLQSSTGLRYRTYNCIECGNPFLERNSEQVMRLSNEMPQVAHANVDGVVDASCPKCAQKYYLSITIEINRAHSDLPLYLQPQSIFLVSAPVKRLRDLYCLECGKAFYSVSDRIKSFVDNVTPMEFIDPGRLGPMEARCRFQHCKQRFYVRV
jgi:hypothetical protein